MTTDGSLICLSETWLHEGIPVSSKDSFRQTVSKCGWTGGGRTAVRGKKGSLPLGLIVF